MMCEASPLDNEGRGLKHQRQAADESADWGIAPRQRGAWIETTCVRTACSPPPASPLDNEGRGLKPRHSPRKGLPVAHRPSTTRGVD